MPTFVLEAVYINGLIHDEANMFTGLREKSCLLIQVVYFSLYNTVQ